MVTVAHPIERGNMRKPANESRSRDLSMALASRKLMKSLDAYGISGEADDRLRTSVMNLLSIINSTWQTSNSFAPVPSESPFARYEQAAIVNEVVSAFDSRKVRATLEAILNGTIVPSARPGVVKEMNKVLYTLENRSLHSYNEQFDEL